MKKVMVKFFMMLVACVVLIGSESFASAKGWGNVTPRDLVGHEYELMSIAVPSESHFGDWGRTFDDVGTTFRFVEKENSIEGIIIEPSDNSGFVPYPARTFSGGLKQLDTILVHYTTGKHSENEWKFDENSYFHLEGGVYLVENGNMLNIWKIMEYDSDGEIGKSVCIATCKRIK